MRKTALALFLSLSTFGCAALVPFEDLTGRNYACKEQLARAVKEIVMNDFTLAINIKLTAANEVLCVKQLDEESMANVAVVVIGSRRDFSEPKPYYVITHIHFSGIHGKAFGEISEKENWIEMKNEKEWFEDWCMNFIRWVYPKEWYEQGCDIFGRLVDGHKIGR